MKRPGFALAVILGAVLVYVLASSPHEDEPDSPSSSPEKAAVLVEKGLDGGDVSLAQFAGKVVLVDFWATWCAPCQEELPDLIALREKLAPRGFEILGVSMDEDGAKTVKRFLKKRPIPYPLALNGGEMEPKGWTVPGLPTAYLIGRDGMVRKRWFGEKDMDELKREVEAALDAK
jgi:thiol-disulfide isomerase/thioredoxin